MAGKGLNKAQIIGNAGKDAELRYTQSGRAVASFSVATSYSWKDQSGNSKDSTTWHNIVAWGNYAEVCGKYVKKGTKLYIEGRIENSSYDDKDGVKKYRSEIVMDNMILLPSGAGGGDQGDGGSYSQNSGSSQGSSAPEPDFDQSIPDADLPF